MTLALSGFGLSIIDLGFNIYDIINFILRYGLLAWAAVIPATLFPFLYAKWFPFWKSTLGQALFVESFGMMLLVDTAVLYALLPVDEEVKRVVGFVVGAIIVAGLWWRLLAISKIRVADKAVYESSKISDDYRTNSDFEDRHRL